MLEYVKNPFLYQQNKEKHIKNNDPGYTRLDFAFEDAATTLAAAGGNSMLGCKGFQSWEPLEREDMFNPVRGKGGAAKWDPAEGGFTTEDVSIIAKKVAKFLGASLSGIAMVDERWFYGNVVTGFPQLPPGIDPAVVMTMMEKMLAAGKSPPMPPMPQARQIFKDTDKPKILDDGTRIIPTSMKWAVVMAFEMDYDAIECELSATGNAAVADGYSRMAITTASLSEFFRSMGYNALPLVNDTALSIPMAIDAGLGELARNGAVITPKYGPRIRLAKVITDMPLIPDRPISFGVTEFCEICEKCAEHCPSDALAKGPRSYEVPDDSGGNPGVLKWPVHGGKCFSFWCENGDSCSNCIRVCPFNKPDGWHHQVTRLLIGGVKSRNLDKLLLKLDDASGYGRALGKARPAREFWSIDRYIHVKS
jgi:reductive dehalogenase